MSERKVSVNPLELLGAPFAIGAATFEMALMTTISLARVARIAVQSADTGFAKYIELSEQELKKGRQHESVKVE